MQLGQRGHSARPRASSPAARVPARARQVFKPDGRGPAVSGCEGRERGVRMTGGARLSSSTSRPRRRRAHRRRFRPRRRQRRAGTLPASSGGCGGGVAARRGALVRRRRGATAEARRRSVVGVVFDCKQKGKERGNGQGCAAVPKQAEGGAGEACTSRSPAARRGGAPVDPEHWGAPGLI